MLFSERRFNQDFTYNRNMRNYSLNIVIFGCEATYALFNFRPSFFTARAK